MTVGVISSMVVVTLASGCAEGCPPGYGHEQDQCVKKTAAAAQVAHPCSALPSTKPDPGGGPATYARVDVPAGSCFWMSRTEVTVGEYQQWLRTVDMEPDGGGIHWDTQVCSWKKHPSRPWQDPRDTCTAMIPSLDAQRFSTNKPVRCVDFCDADAFCRATQNRRLCWGLGSSAVQGPRAVPREWALACTNSFTTQYPWGTSLDGGGLKNDCNVSPTGTCVECTPYEVGRRQKCLTEKTGITDLLGNVAEWAWACTFAPNDAGDAPRNCAIRGGGFTEPLKSCYDDETVSNDARRIDLGFRCCADLTNEETQRVTVDMQSVTGTAPTAL